MSRARILADYVSSGDELADKAPLASPAFTGTPTGITAAHLTTAAALPAAVTGGSGLTALGTVTEGNLSNTAIVYPAGSIAQIQFMDIVWSADVSQSTSAAKLWNGTTTRINMTLRTANAKVIGFATNSTAYVGGGTVYGQFYFVAKTGTDSLASAPSGHSESVRTRYRGENYKPFNVTMSGAITLSNSIDDVFCFAPCFNSDGAGNFYINSDGANSRGHFWVAEIYQ
jgi:hypothetical protein